jgi:hypothetical protein
MINIISSKELDKMIRKSRELDAIMSEFNRMENNNRNCVLYYSKEVKNYNLDIGGESSCIIGLMEKYFDILNGK